MGFFGCLGIFGGHPLGKCYYVPRLSLGIISISQLTRNGELTNIVSGGVSNIIDEYGECY